MAEYKIILADDHEILRAGLRSLITQESFLKVVGEAGDGEELLRQLGRVKCDLIVMDLSMPHMDGLAAIKDIRQKFPKIRILVLTMQKDHEHFKYAMGYGASGYLLKDDAYEQLVLAIKMILKGKKFISPSVASLETERFVRSLEETDVPSLEILSKRETEILKLVAGGLANKIIALKLKISIRTVETHRANLTNKLGIKNTANLVKYAFSKGLI